MSRSYASCTPPSTSMMCRGTALLLPVLNVVKICPVIAQLFYWDIWMQSAKVSAVQEKWNICYYINGRLSVHTVNFSCKEVIK
jgi:hypothetical protein